MSAYICHRADNGYCITPAIISGRRCIKCPGRTLLNGLVGAAARNHWGRCIRHRDLLAATTAVAAGIGGNPGPSCIKCAATMTTYIRHRAGNSYCITPAIVSGRRGIKCPGRTLLHCLIRAATRNHRRGRIHDNDRLSAL